jgi:predicted nucleic acid-binding protein
VYTLDTNVIIAYYRRDPRVVPVLREILRDPTSSIYVSTITEAELFSFANLSEEEKDFIKAILQTISLIPPISQVARIAGTLRATYGIKLADAFIAVLSQSLDKDEQSCHFLLSMQPRHRTALRAFVTNSLRLSAAPCEWHA